MIALLLRRYSYFALALCLGTVQSAYSDETLAGLRDDVRSAPTSAPDPPEKRDRDDCDDDASIWDNDEECCDDEDSDWGLGGLLGLAITSPFWGPPIVIGDDYSQPGYFAHFPHQYDCGYMLIDPVEALGMDGPCQPHAWAARARGEFGTAFGGIDWIGGRVQLDTRWRLGLESDFRYVRENMAAGRDDLWLGDANVLFRFAQSEHWQFRTGLGCNFLSDRTGSDFGFNFTYAADWQPAKPLTFATELDLGTLGHASVVHVRTTAGIAIGVSEVFVGYDLYDVGSTQIQGLVAGVQLWY